MSAPLTDDQRAALEAELSAEFGLTYAEVLDLEATPDVQRAQLVADWRLVKDLSWTQQPSRWQRFLDILNALAAVANPISAVAGGVTGLAGALGALKSI